MILKTKNIITYILAYLLIITIMYLLGYRGINPDEQLLTFHIVVPLFNLIWVFTVLVGVRYEIRNYFSRGKDLSRVFYSRKRLKLEAKYMSKTRIDKILKRFTSLANESGFEFNTKSENDYVLRKGSSKSIIVTKIDLNIYHDIVQTVIKTAIRNEGNSYISKITIFLCLLTLIISLTSITGFIGTFILGLFALGQHMFMQEVIEKDVNNAHKFILEVIR